MMGREGAPSLGPSWPNPEPRQNPTSFKTRQFCLNFDYEVMNQKEPFEDSEKKSKKCHFSN